MSVSDHEESNILKSDIEQHERFPTFTKPLTDCHYVFKTSKKKRSIKHCICKIFKLIE